MKIAVPYLDGEIFEHFGKSAQFKIYDIEDGAVADSKVVDSEGEGHAAVTSFLAALGVEIVICSGIGEGAFNALNEAGIKVVSGISGQADEIVNLLTGGPMDSEGPNCNCGGNCGCGDGGCGEGGCGGCGGGCGGCGGGMPEPLFEGPNVGKACVVNYHGTLDDGTCFDSSFERGEPIQFICGVGMMIPGFDKAVATMNVGDTVEVHLEPEEAYGPFNPEAVIDLPIENLPGSEDLSVGDVVFLANNYGQQFPVKVLEKTESTIKLDANHEFAGKALNFKIELVEILED